MKVMMLGASEAGKTTFMAAMYSLMSERKVWHIDAWNTGEGERLKELASNIKNGQYPARTDTKQEYTFDFRCESDHLFPFTWFDFRGGAIFQSTTDPVSKYVAQRLKEADALIVFFDATLLDTEKGEKLWRRIQVLCMNYAVRANVNNSLSLTIVLTKADLVRYSPELTNRERSQSLIKADLAYFHQDVLNTRTGKIIKNFIENFSKNQYLLGMLSWSAINKGVCYGIDNPFYNAMWIGLIKEVIAQREHLERQREIVEERRDTYQNRSFLVDLWVDWFCSHDKDLERLEREKRNFERREVILKRVEKNFKKMKDYLLANNGGGHGYVLF